MKRNIQHSVLIQHYHIMSNSNKPTYNVIILLQFPSNVVKLTYDSPFDSNPRKANNVEDTIRQNQLIL